MPTPLSNPFNVQQSSSMATPAAPTAINQPLQTQQAQPMFGLGAAFQSSPQMQGVLGGLNPFGQPLQTQAMLPQPPVQMQQAGLFPAPSQPQQTQAMIGLGQAFPALGQPPVQMQQAGLFPAPSQNPAMQPLFNPATQPLQGAGEQVLNPPAQMTPQQHLALLAQQTSQINSMMPNVSPQQQQMLQAELDRLNAQSLEARNYIATQPAVTNTPATFDPHIAAVNAQQQVGLLSVSPEAARAAQADRDRLQQQQVGPLPVNPEVARNAQADMDLLQQQQAALAAKRAARQAAAMPVDTPRVSTFKSGGLVTSVSNRVNTAARADIAKANKPNTQRGTGLATRGLGKFKVR